MARIFNYQTYSERNRISCGDNKMRSRIFNYQTHDDIDNIHKDYMLSVTNKTDITTIPISTINIYLTEMNRYYDEKENNQ